MSNEVSAVTNDPGGCLRKYDVEGRHGGVVVRDRIVGARALNVTDGNTNKAQCICTRSQTP